MKKITLLFALLISSIGFSQEVVQSFEADGAINGDPFGGMAAPTITTDTGTNATKVLKIVANSATEVWQGINLNLTKNVDLSTTKTMTIDVFSATPITFLVKVNGGLNGAPEAAAPVTHNGNSTWQTLSFTFNTALDGKAASANGVYSAFVIHAYWRAGETAFGGTKDERTFYVDNLSGPIVSTDEVVQSFEADGAINGDPFGGMAAPTITTDTGTNATKVLKIVANSATEVWQGINLNLTKNVDLSTTKTMTMDVYSATAITFLVKVNGGINGAPEAAAEVTHNGDSTWQTLSFTFDTALDGKAAAASGIYASFVIHAYWNAGNTTFDGTTKDTRTFFVDNFKGPAAGAAPAAPEPTDAPPTPATYAASNVISLYSEAFTPSATISNVNWDDSLFEEVTIAGNKVLKITGSNFIGMNLDTYLNASNMTHLHMDYWLAVDWVEGQVINPKLSNHAAQAGETSALDISNPINSQAEIKNWQSKDFVLNGDRGAIKEFLITQAGRTGVYYLDNVYMYKAGTASVSDNELLNVTMYPNPTSSRLNISAASTIKNAQIFNVLGKKVMSLDINKNSESIDVSKLASGIYLIKYTIDSAVGTAKFIKE